MPRESAWRPPLGFGGGSVHVVCHSIRDPPAAAEARDGGRPYTRPVIDTPPRDGFLSVGQATARRIAIRAAGGTGTCTLLVHGPAGAGKEAFVADLLALHFCEAAEAS